MEAALQYQAARGIEARFSVWDAISGPASRVEIIAEFDNLLELEQFEELAAQDQNFAQLRRAVREAMVFESTENRDLSGAGGVRGWGAPCSRAVR